jgi:hypothetical protein
MKNLIKFILKLFAKRKAHPSLFFALLSGAIKDVFTEMGYRFNKEDIK